MSNCWVNSDDGNREAVKKQWRKRNTSSRKWMRCECKMEYLTTSCIQTSDVHVLKFKFEPLQVLSIEDFWIWPPTFLNWTWLSGAFIKVTQLVIVIYLCENTTHLCPLCLSKLRTPLFLGKGATNKLKPSPLVSLCYPVLCTSFLSTIPSCVLALFWEHRQYSDPSTNRL